MSPFQVCTVLTDLAHPPLPERSPRPLPVPPHPPFTKARLLSVGATLEIEFGNFIGLQFPATLGVTYSYNAGTPYRNPENLTLMPGRHFIGPVFNIDF